MIWMTCVQDNREHAVTDEQVGIGSAYGRYLARCGRLITPGSLALPPGRRCLTCHAALAPAIPAPMKRRWWQPGRDA
jgi:hypothetical protein